MKDCRKNMLNRGFGLLVFTAVLILIFICVNIGSALYFGRWKADLTDNAKYTLSRAAENIIGNLEQPVDITLFLSRSLAKENPPLYQYSAFVSDVLNSVKTLSAGKISIDIKNPEPYSLTEEEAVRAGIVPFTDSTGQNSLYFGLFFRSNNGSNYTIPLLLPQRASLLENDIGRALSVLNASRKKTVGLVAPTFNLNGKRYGEKQGEVPAFMQLIKNGYNVKEISAETVQIPSDIDILVVINPDRVSKLFVYALDQFILRGGKLLLFLDPFSQKTAESTGPQPQGSANINLLLRNLGVSFDTENIVGDSVLGQPVYIGEQLKNYPYQLHLTAKQINQQAPITRGIGSINLGTPGHLVILGGENPITPLLQTTNNSGLTDSGDYAYNTLKQNLDGFEKSGELYTLGILTEGYFDSAFTDNILAGTAYENRILPFIARSVSRSEIIIIADSDLLFDENWVDGENSDTTRFHGIVPAADNGALLLRSLDYLSGQKDLASIRDKTALNAEKSIALSLYEKIYAVRTGEYSGLTTKLEQLQNENDFLEEEVRNKQLVLSMPLLQKLEQNKKTAAALRQQIKRLDYLMKKEYDDKISGIILTNCAIIPLLLVLVVWAGASLLFLRGRRKIREILNDEKIS